MPFGNTTDKLMYKSKKALHDMVDKDVLLKSQKMFTTSLSPQNQMFPSAQMSRQFSFKNNNSNISDVLA